MLFSFLTNSLRGSYNVLKDPQSFIEQIHFTIHLALYTDYIFLYSQRSVCAAHIFLCCGHTLENDILQIVKNVGSPCHSSYELPIAPDPWMGFFFLNFSVLGISLPWSWPRCAYCYYCYKFMCSLPPCVWKTLSLCHCQLPHTAK